MTKKAREIYEKYERKMSTTLWLYEERFIEIDKFKDTIRSYSDEFDTLISKMFNYDLLNTKDFKELGTLGCSTWRKYLEKGLRY